LITNFIHQNQNKPQNNQGSGEAFDSDTSKEIRDTMIKDSNYNKFVEQWLAREIARTNITLGTCISVVG
jgi:hypothetical protein